MESCLQVPSRSLVVEMVDITNNHLIRKMVSCVEISPTQGNPGNNIRCYKEVEKWYSTNPASSSELNECLRPFRTRRAIARENCPVTDWDRSMKFLH
jgi:hypothetical protein